MVSDMCQPSTRNTHTTGRRPDSAKRLRYIATARDAVGTSECATSVARGSHSPGLRGVGGRHAFTGIGAPSVVFDTDERREGGGATAETIDAQTARRKPVASAVAVDTERGRRFADPKVGGR